MTGIKIDHFEGMNNILVKEKQSLSMPSMILNANVDIDGSLQKRTGHELIVDLPNAHSLWTNGKGVILCAALGVIYLLENKTPVRLADTGQPDAPLSYLEIDNKIYISNKHWTGMVDPAQRVMKPWGEPIPAAPILVPASGGLPPGDYRICITTMSEYGRTSGNSPLSSMSLTETGGFEIVNLPARASVWVTDPNGAVMLYAGTGPIITELPRTQESLPTMWGSPPAPMRHMCWAFGRVWGIRGNRVIYSEPYQPELFRLGTAFFDMGEEGLMTAKGVNGMFIGCLSKTIYYAGCNPAEMIEVPAGPGVVPGTLCYADDLGELGRDVPIWLARDGVYAGLADGRVINILKDRLQIDPQQLEGASVYRVKDGRRQMLFSMKHNMSKPGSHEVGFGDQASCEVVRKGAVI